MTEPIHELLHVEAQGLMQKYNGLSPEVAKMMVEEELPTPDAITYEDLQVMSDEGEPLTKLLVDMIRIQNERVEKMMDEMKHDGFSYYKYAMVHARLERTKVIS